MPCVIAAFAAVSASGWASKKYVSREVGEVNQRVETLSTEVEKTQERVKRNEVRIDDVNSQAQSGINDVLVRSRTWFFDRTLRRAHQTRSLQLAGWQYVSQCLPSFVQHVVQKMTLHPMQPTPAPV